MEVFSKGSDVLHGSLSLLLKKHIVKVLLWNTILYGSETWTLQKNEIKRFEACEMCISRKMVKMPWTLSTNQ